MLACRDFVITYTSAKIGGASAFPAVFVKKNEDVSVRASKVRPVDATPIVDVIKANAEERSEIKQRRYNHMHRRIYL